MPPIRGYLFAFSHFPYLPQFIISVLTMHFMYSLKTEYSKFTKHHRFKELCILARYMQKALSFLKATSS